MAAEGQHHSNVHAATLNLGAPDLVETRTSTALTAGVTLTKISRGSTDSSLFWTAEISIPADSPDPDAPSTALSTPADAQIMAA
ncbi:hypothetical protein IV498_17765 [Paenarthrobacter sp. Z7-10]|uniref:hypothetical protein n=1 Tax=Paenarthrobacter sp. Z7-10 TaxID=2787635 RepID=UPI0022A94F0A|nr:hypothetical protein [Paenarthrobacter sp. Z7-10]MCZ2404957.1 hypothetical protein [Paenarthrobacter sp. Z7-10]